MSDEIVAQLHTVRMTVDFASFSFGDHVAAFAAGVFAALLVALLFAPFLATRRPLAAVVNDDLAAVRDLPAPERLFHQATLFVRIGGVVEENYRQALYSPSVSLDLDAFDREILQFARKKR